MPNKHLFHSFLWQSPNCKLGPRSVEELALSWVEDVKSTHLLAYFKLVTKSFFTQQSEACFDLISLIAYYAFTNEEYLSHVV